MTNEEWAELDKSMTAINASMDRLSAAMSDLGDTLSGLPEGKHQKTGVSVKITHRRFVWRKFWRRIFS